jgi:hypothetical protein
MTIFSITPDNNITAHATEAEAKSITEAEQFSNAKELAKLAAKWPASRLLDIWNSLPGQKPLKKFTNRKAAVSRIWTAIQNVAPDTAAHGAPVAPKKAKSGKRATTSAKPATARESSKTAQVLELVKRPGGATLENLMTTTNWQAHSVRGFVAGTLRKKMGLTIVSGKREDGQRAYWIN